MREVEGCKSGWRREEWREGMKSSAKSQLVAFTLLLWTQTVSVQCCVVLCKLNHNSFHQLDLHSLRNELCVYVKMMQFLDVQIASFSDFILTSGCDVGLSAQCGRSYDMQIPAKLHGQFLTEIPQTGRMTMPSCLRQTFWFEHRNFLKITTLCKKKNGGLS